MMPDPDLYFGKVGRSASTAGFSATQTAGSSTGDCPYAKKQTATQLCDVNGLIIENTTDKQKLEISTAAKYDTSLNSYQCKLLGSDDLLMQVVADYKNDGSYDPDKMKYATIHMTASGNNKCNPEKHLLSKWESTTSDLGRQFWVNPKTKEAKLLAADTRLLHGGEFLERFWSFSKNRRQYRRFSASSCGVAPMVQKANHSLSGRIEVFPNDQFELIFNIPPFKKISQKNLGTIMQ